MFALFSYPWWVVCQKLCVIEYFYFVLLCSACICFFTSELCFFAAACYLAFWFAPVCLFAFEFLCDADATRHVALTKGGWLHLVLVHHHHHAHHHHHHFHHQKLDLLTPKNLEIIIIIIKWLSSWCRRQKAWRVQPRAAGMPYSLS